MSTGFTVSQIGGYKADLDDILIRREYFNDGTLWTCGINSAGQLGDNSTTNKSSPVTTTGGGTNWKQVEGGELHITAVKTDGTLWTWGYNTYGQLGDNSTTNKSSPVTTSGGGTNWKQVSGGYGHTAAIKTDGTLWTWGFNNKGQLGDNTIVSERSPITTADGGTNWKQVACGNYHTAAVKTDGTLWTWGYNTSGQLGDGTTVSKRSPITTTGGGTNWKHVACGYSHTAAIKTDGTLWTWGYNAYGQLGDNSTTNKSSPVTTAGGGTNWKQVACGHKHTAAIKTDGTLWTCGYNNKGQLGDGTFTAKSSPITTAAAGTNWKQVACGGLHTTAVKTDGTLWTWGYDAYGQLGDGTTNDKSSPVTTSGGGTTWKQVACGYGHTAAITDNTL